MVGGVPGKMSGVFVCRSELHSCQEKVCRTVFTMVTGWVRGSSNDHFSGFLTGLSEIMRVKCPSTFP